MRDRAQPCPYQGAFGARHPGSEPHPAHHESVVRLCPRLAALHRRRLLSSAAGPVVGPAGFCWRDARSMTVRVCSWGSASGGRRPQSPTSCRDRRHDLHYGLSPFAQEPVPGGAAAGRARRPGHLSARGSGAGDHAGAGSLQQEQGRIHLHQARKARARLRGVDWSAFDRFWIEGGNEWQRRHDKAAHSEFQGPKSATVSAEVKREVARRDGWTCRYCGLRVITSATMTALERRLPAGLSRAEKVHESIGSPYAMRETPHVGRLTRTHMVGAAPWTTSSPHAGPATFKREIARSTSSASRTHSPARRFPQTGTGSTGASALALCKERALDASDTDKIDGKGRHHFVRHRRYPSTVTTSIRPSRNY